MMTFEESLKAFSTRGLYGLTFEQSLKAFPTRGTFIKSLDDADNLDYRTILTEQNNMKKIDDIHQLILDSRGTFIKSLDDADNLDYRTILTEQNNMQKIDDILQEKLLKKLDKLNKKIAWIGDKDLRGKLDYHATEMYKLIIQDPIGETQISEELLHPSTQPPENPDWSVIMPPQRQTRKV